MTPTKVKYTNSAKKHKNIFGNCQSNIALLPPINMVMSHRNNRPSILSIQKNKQQRPSIHAKDNFQMKNKTRKTPQKELLKVTTKFE